VNEQAGIALGGRPPGESDVGFVGRDFVAGAAMIESPEDVVAVDGVAALIVEVDGGQSFCDEVVDFDPGAGQRGLDRRFDAGVAQPAVTADQAFAVQHLVGGDRTHIQAALREVRLGIP
jgi:hypothetical protein